MKHHVFEVRHGVVVYYEAWLWWETKDPWIAFALKPGRSSQGGQ